MGTHELAEESDRDPDRALRVRAFFGLPVPDEQRRTLERYLVECAKLAPQFRWTPAENLHLTVRFLGHVEANVAEEIADRLEDARPPSFELALGKAGTFKRSRLARVVWLGLNRGEAESVGLAKVVEAECVRAGLEPETRAFSPHLTLARARARDGAALPELPQLPETSAWTAEQLILFRSHLGRAGSVYEPLRSITLR